MIGRVHLTGDELTAASSAVAAVAIVGGYLGVRSANRNALKIAREERSSRRKEELDALKRTIYAQCLAALTALAAVSIEVSVSQGRTSPAVQQARIAALRQGLNAIQVAHNAVAELELIAPDLLRELADEALTGANKCTQQDGSAFARGIAKLRVAMHYDLQGISIPSPGELDRMVAIAMPKPSPEPES
jgi:hypothetical protein